MRKMIKFIIFGLEGFNYGIGVPTLLGYIYFSQNGREKNFKLF